LLFALALLTVLNLPAAPARAGAARLAVLELRNEARMKPAEVACFTDRVRDAASRAIGADFVVSCEVLRFDDALCDRIPDWSTQLVP
jgi:hypothetical protein